MEEKINAAKAAVTAVIAAFGAMFGWYGWLAVLFATGMTIDIITGVLVACIKGEWESRVMREGLAHKVGSIFAVLVAVLMDAALSLVVGNLPGVQLPFVIPAILGPLTMVWYIIAEFGSIVENIGLMGVPVPGFLQKAIKVLNNAVDAAGDAASGGEEEKTEE